MPFIIDRAQAIARLALEPSSGCLICEILQDAEASGLVIHRNRLVTVVLSRYPRQWGHLMVLINRHVTSFEDLDDTEWTAANRASLCAARLLESQLQPSRCFVASLGSERDDLPMTSPHMHVHVIPVGDADTRPSEIFSWQQGVFDGHPEEWSALATKLQRAWIDTTDTVKNPL